MRTRGQYLPAADPGRNNENTVPIRGPIVLERTVKRPPCFSMSSRDDANEAAVFIENGRGAVIDGELLLVPAYQDRVVG